MSLSPPRLFPPSMAYSPHVQFPPVAVSPHGFIPPWTFPPMSKTCHWLIPPIYKICNRLIPPISIEILHVVSLVNSWMVSNFAKYYLQSLCMNGVRFHWELQTLWNCEWCQISLSTTITLNGVRLQWLWMVFTETVVFSEIWYQVGKQQPLCCVGYKKQTFQLPTSFLLNNDHGYFG